MPQMVIWPFMARTMVEAGFSVKTAILRPPAPFLPPDDERFLKFAVFVQDLRTSGVGASVFGWGRKVEVEERAKKVARMLFFIKHSMQTKTYDQFVASFSNPDDQPNVLKRYDHRAHFTMHMSESCWYNADVAYPHNGHGTGSVTLHGGGDDFGVFITAAPADDLASVDLHVAFDEKAGRDAKSMVRTLEAMPKWTRAEPVDGDLGLEP
jgi:hypothetical protein